MRPPSLEEEEAAVVAARAVDGVHRPEQPLGRDEPRAEVLVDVEDQYEVLGLEVAGDRRVMAVPLPKRRPRWKLTR
jgi:hypothetical protein